MGIFSDVLLVSDYDNTLTEPGGLPGMDGKITKTTRIAPANLEAIAAFVREGGLFTIASGRTRIYYENVIGRAIVPNAPLVLANGAHIYDPVKQQDVLVRPMDENAMHLARDVMQRFRHVAIEAQRTDAMCIVYAPKEDRSYYDHISYHIKGDIDTFEGPWIKMHFSGAHEQIVALMEYLQAHYPAYEYAMSVPTVCEMQVRGVTKGDASRWLARQLGRKILVCVGDAPNDVPMLEEADYAFVPENGFESVRQMGFLDAAPSRKGAVADVIRQMRAILQRKGQA